MTITEFLEARIAEDEAAARAAAYVPDEDYPTEADNPWGEQSEFAGRGGKLFRHVLRHNPSRVLAECAAKRAILAAQKNQEDNDDDMAWIVASEVLLKALAAVYSDHPNYQQEWALTDS
jgi:hypothetical protein